MRRADKAAKIGEIRIEQGQYDAAERALLEAVKMNPNGFQSHLHLSSLFQKQQNLPRALRHAEIRIDIRKI